MRTSRRGFLAGLVGLSAVALATKLNLPSTEMAEEVRSDLLKDLATDRVQISMLGAAPQEPVWASVAGTARFWADEIGKKLAEQVDRDVLSKLPAMTQELARRLDTDLREAKVPANKQIIVGLPEFRVTRWGQIEISAGLAKQDTIWGEEYRVEHIRPTELIIPGLDKRGQAEYSGLILPS